MDDTFDVTRRFPVSETMDTAGRLLRLRARGEVSRITLGLVLVLATSGPVLFQPWPLKLVVDSVLSGRSIPSALAQVADAVVIHSPVAIDPRLALLLALCAEGPRAGGSRAQHLLPSGARSGAPRRIGSRPLKTSCANEARSLCAAAILTAGTLTFVAGFLGARE
jgi:hypothetical protein